MFCVFSQMYQWMKQIKAEKAFKDALFNKEYDLNITKTDLLELLEVATKNQLF